MAATTSGYGAYNPAAVDPYPIESDLAKLAVGNSPENAANLLDLYQLQRTTDAANYGHEMGIQHDFARQQLAQQLKETYLKNAMDAVKTRGGLSVFNQLAPESAINSNIAGPIETGLSDAQAATTAEHAASAAKHGLEAGFSTDLPRLTGMSSGLLTGQVTPLQLQVQAARNAGHGGGGGGAGKTMSVPYKQYVNEDGQLVNGMIKVPVNATDEQIAAIKANADRIYAGINPKSGTGVPGGIVPENVAPSGPATPPKSPPRTPATSLPNNPNAAPQDGPRAASPEYIRDPKVQNVAKERFKLLTPGEQQALRGSIKGVMPVVKLQGGGLGYVGPNGSITVMP